MADRFAKFSTVLSDPASAALAVPVSNNALAFVTRKLYVGTGGNVAVRMVGYGTGNTANLNQTDITGNNDVTFVNVPNGTTLEIRVSHVFTTTTANNLIALY